MKSFWMLFCIVLSLCASVSMGSPPQVLKDIEGTLELRDAFYEDTNHSTLMFFLRTFSGDLYSLYLDPSVELKPIPGKRVHIRSAIQFSQDMLYVQSLDTLSALEETNPVLPPLPNVAGDHKAIVFLISFKDMANPWTVDQVKKLVFSDLKSHELETSFGKTSLSGDIFGWFQSPLSSDMYCDDIYKSIAPLAISIAKAQGINLNNYTHRVYYFPKTPSCRWSGLGSVGTYGGYADVWVNGSISLNVIAHEIGHNFGLFHANAMNCGGRLDPLDPSCTPEEYADPADTMGNRSAGHFSAYQKERLGWLSPTQITPVLASGRFTIPPYEKNSAEPKALKILKANNPNGSKDYYYIEYRQPLGFDNELLKFNPNGGNLTAGILIHQGNDSDPSLIRLLDMNPSTVSFFDSALTPGKTFTDKNTPQGVLSVTLNSISPSGADISVSLGNINPPNPTCARYNPVVMINPINQTVTQGGNATYAVSIKNQDTAPCGASTFDLSHTGSGALYMELNNNQRSVSINPGQTFNTTLYIGSLTTIIPTQYPFSVNVKNSNGFSAKGSGIFTVTQ